MLLMLVLAEILSHQLIATASHWRLLLEKHSHSLLLGWDRRLDHLCLLSLGGRHLLC